MSSTETAPHGATETAAQAGPAQGETTTETAAAEAPAQAIDWEAESRKWEKRAKENGGKAKELERLQQASMSEADKAISEAESRGRQSAAAEYGSRLVAAEFATAIGRRDPEAKPADITDLIDLSKFVGDDGQPDTRAIQSAVERLIPEADPQRRPPSFDSGARGTPPKGGNMNDEIRARAGRST